MAGLLMLVLVLRRGVHDAAVGGDGGDLKGGGQTVVGTGSICRGQAVCSSVCILGESVLCVLCVCVCSSGWIGW